MSHKSHKHRDSSSHSKSSKDKPPKVQVGLSETALADIIEAIGETGVNFPIPTTLWEPVFVDVGKSAKTAIVPEQGDAVETDAGAAETKDDTANLQAEVKGKEPVKKLDLKKPFSLLEKLAGKEKRVVKKALQTIVQPIADEYLVDVSIGEFNALQYTGPPGAVYTINGQISFQGELSHRNNPVSTYDLVRFGILQANVETVTGTVVILTSNTVFCLGRGEDDADIELAYTIPISSTVTLQTGDVLIAGFDDTLGLFVPISNDGELDGVPYEVTQITLQRFSPLP